MRRSGGGRCKADGTDEGSEEEEEEIGMPGETSLASILATPKTNALAVLGLIGFGMLIL